jgi:PAS domain S-box-containing protein
MGSGDRIQGPAVRESHCSESRGGELQSLESRLRWAQESQALAVRILNLLNQEMTAKDAIRKVLEMVKEFTGFEAVAIRLREGEDFPYFVTNGFPASFVEAERYLCDRNENGEINRDPDGNAVLECMCGNILRGRTDPSYSFFTEGGSFWSCHTTELLATTTDKDRQTRTRNRCNSAGYESVALIPLRSGSETHGLLQLNDSRKDCFTLDLIAFFEGIGASIGIVLTRMRAEEALRKYREELEKKVIERTEDLRKANEALHQELAERQRVEKALRESKAKLEAALESMTDAVFISDVQGNFIDFNEAFATFHKFRNKEECAKTLAEYPLFLDVFMDDGKLAPLEQWAVPRALRGETVMNAEYTLKRRDTGESWVGSYSFAPLRDQNGTIVGSVVTGRDITEKKRAEEALKLSEERLRLAQEAAKAGTWEWDLRTNENFWSDELWALYGLEPHSCQPSYEAWLDTIHPDDRANAERAVKEAASRGTELIAEWRTNQDLGQPRWLMSRGRPVHDDKGQVVAYLGIVIDISHRKQTEDALRQSEVRYRSLFENIGNGVAVYSAERDGEDFIFVDFNASAERIDEKDRKEIIGESILKVFPGVKEFGLFEAIRRVWRTGRPEHLPIAHYKDDRIQGWRDNFVYKLPSGEVVAAYSDETERKRAEEALRLSEEKLRLIAETIEDVFWMTTPDLHRMLYISPAYERVWGRTVESLYASPKSFLESVHPEDREKLVRTIAEHISSQWTCEYRILQPDGTIRWIHDRGYPILNADGNLVLRTGVSSDITERKRAERAIQESEQRYRAVFNIASVGIDVVNRQGQFVDMNETFSRFLRYPPEELRHLTILDVTHPEDVQRSRDMHEAIVRGELNEYRLEKRYVGKDGAIIWSDTAVSAIRDADGQYLATVGVIRDITSQKKSEEARIRLATAVEQAVEGIVITDIEGTIQYVNPAYEKITGYSRDEVVGQKPMLLSSEEGNPTAQRDVIETLSRGERWSGHLVKRRKDSTLYEEDVTVTPVLDHQGNLKNFVVVKRDVTKEVGLQRQLLQAQKMEAIGTLAGGVAHDFNNILQVALGYSELLLGDASLPGHSRADLHKVYDSAKRGADLVQRLMTFSRKTEIRPQPLNLNRRIRELRKMLERTVPKMIEIDLVLNEGIARVNADPTQMDQVLMNLAVNARDAMPDGGKLVIETSNVLIDEESAKAFLDAKPGPHVLLTVKDTGTGMDRDTLEHIFEPFYTTKESAEGTGLGLAIVHGIVKQHGGHVRCYSEPGLGSTFRIYLPALVSDDEAAEIKIAAWPQGGSETILLVDDDERVRDLGSRILTKAGYKVLTATNGKEALETYRVGAPQIQLVLLDLIMPEMGGKQCLAEIREMNPRAKVVIASGFSANGPTNDALSLGARGFVDKPYEARQLLQVVRSALDAE